MDLLVLSEAAGAALVAAAGIRVDRYLRERPGRKERLRARSEWRAEWLVGFFPNGLKCPDVGTSEPELLRLDHPRSLYEVLGEPASNLRAMPIEQHRQLQETFGPPRWRAVPVSEVRDHPSLSLDATDYV